MAYFFSPIGNNQTIDANGDPLVGGTISTFLAGTTTPATTYTDDTGGTAQGVVMTLNSLGYPTNGPVWLLGGTPLKFVIKNASGVVQSTFDDVSGIGDTSAAPDQWVLYGAAPTYISATSFSVAGDQTNTFQIRRRVKSSNTGGTVYSTISNSTFAAGITTITVVNDTGQVLDSGLSQVSYGLISATNISTPSPITLSAAVATTSGTEKIITGIPAWARRVNFNVIGVSVSGTSPIILQLGTSSGSESTGYSGTVAIAVNALSSTVTALAGGFGFSPTGTGGASQTFHGRLTLDLADAATNTWSCAGSLGRSDAATVFHLVAGTKPLVGLLDRVRLTTFGGADTFDAGSISVSWE
jgi:hypothetical protein